MSFVLVVSVLNSQQYVLGHRVTNNVSEQQGMSFVLLVSVLNSLT